MGDVGSAVNNATKDASLGATPRTLDDVREGINRLETAIAARRADRAKHADEVERLKAAAEAAEVAAIVEGTEVARAVAEKVKAELLAATDAQTEAMHSVEPLQRKVKELRTQELKLESSEAAARNRSVLARLSPGADEDAAALRPLLARCHLRAELLLAPGHGLPVATVLKAALGTEFYLARMHGDSLELKQRLAAEIEREA